MAKCQKMECPIGCKGMERTSDGATKSSNSRSTDWSMRYSPHAVAVWRGGLARFLRGFSEDIH